MAGLAPPLVPCSPHLQEDLPELGADLEQGVQVAAVREDAVGREIVGLEGPVPPGAAVGGDAEYMGLVGAAHPHPHPHPRLWGYPYLEIISGLSSASCLEMLVLKALPLLTQ